MWYIKVLQLENETLKNQLVRVSFYLLFAFLILACRINNTSWDYTPGSLDHVESMQILDSIVCDTVLVNTIYERSDQGIEVIGCFNDGGLTRIGAEGFTTNSVIKTTFYVLERKMLGYRYLESVYSKPIYSSGSNPKVKEHKRLVVFNTADLTIEYSVGSWDRGELESILGEFQNYTHVLMN